MSRAVVLVAAFVLALSGCTIQRAQTAARARAEMVGMSKGELLSCAGVPVRQDRADGLEFLTYASGGDSVGSTVVSQTSPSTAFAVGKSTRRYCEATFVLKDGVVQRVNYQGRTGGLLTRGEQCAFVVENCLKP
jgi:hypothetical protein